MSMSKTELDTLHTIIYFVLEFERQERVNCKTIILRLCLRDANTGNAKYSMLTLGFAYRENRFKGR